MGNSTKYTGIVHELITALGGTDNITRVKIDGNNIVFTIFDKNNVDYNKLHRNKFIRSVEDSYGKITLGLKHRDVNYTFNEIKNLPGSEIIKKKQPEEEVDDRPYLERLATTLFGDILPLALFAGAISAIASIISLLTRL